MLKKFTGQDFSESCAFGKANQAADENDQKRKHQ
jgi:hypothetical protein